MLLNYSFKLLTKENLAKAHNHNGKNYRTSSSEDASVMHHRNSLGGQTKFLLMSISLFFSSAFIPPKSALSCNEKSEIKICFIKISFIMVLYEIYIIFAKYRLFFVLYLKKKRNIKKRFANAYFEMFYIVDYLHAVEAAQTL